MGLFVKIRLKSNYFIFLFNYLCFPTRKALILIAKEKIVISNRTSDAKGVQIKGHTLQKSPHAISITFDIDGRAVKSKCSCYEFKKTGLSKGPCEHLIALMKLNELEKENENPN